MVISSSKKYNRQGLVLPHCVSPLQKSGCQNPPCDRKAKQVPKEDLAAGLGEGVGWHWAVQQNEHPTRHTSGIKLL